MWLIYFGIIFIIFCEIFTIINSINRKRKLNNYELEQSKLEVLKNALLTAAIISIKEQDMDHNFDYTSYDGTKYPPLSGSSIHCACFSYILNRFQFRKSLFYTKIMESKLDAIEKYLAKNLSTKEQVDAFFNEFCNKIIIPVLEKRDL
jgi:hypothetical protein